MHSKGLSSLRCSVGLGVGFRGVWLPGLRVEGQFGLSVDIGGT